MAYSQNKSEVCLLLACSVPWSELEVELKDVNADEVKAALNHAWSSGAGSAPACSPAEEGSLEGRGDGWDATAPRRFWPPKAKNLLHSDDCAGRSLPACKHPSPYFVSPTSL